MSDKLFVRDIIEQLRKLDPQLPTNIASLSTGSFQDGTRVHLLDGEQDEEQSLKDQIKALDRTRSGMVDEIKRIERQREDARVLNAKEALEQSTKIAKLTERLRKIREQARQRELPLP